jgi:hypothetical protein
MLYSYGEGDEINKHMRFIVAVSCISLAYLLLALAAEIIWVAIVVIVSLVVVVLVVYSVYQVIGLYYWLFFKDDGKCSEEEMQPHIVTKLKDDKESATKL